MNTLRRSLADSEWLVLVSKARRRLQPGIGRALLYRLKYTSVLSTLEYAHSGTKYIGAALRAGSAVELERTGHLANV